MALGPPGGAPAVVPVEGKSLLDRGVDLANLPQQCHAVFPVSVKSVRAVRLANLRLYGRDVLINNTEGGIVRF